MEEEENKPIVEKKAGLEKNLIVPILVVAMLTGLAVWLVPEDEDDAFKKPLPQLGTVIQPLDAGDSVIRPLGEEGTAESGEESGDSADTSGDGADASADNRDLTSDSNDSSQTSESAAPEQGKDVTDDGDVRTVIAKLQEEGSGSGQKAFAQAEARRKVGDNENAYLLYFFAAKNGNADAAMVLGTMADPIYYTSISSALDAPDPAQAIKWYKMAINAGNGKARQNLANLTQRIKKQAENGSSEAQRLMLQLQ